MAPTDREALYALIRDVHSFYRQDTSAFAFAVWWEAMKPYDLTAVRDAMNRHAVNPDNGQFCPKPADVVKLIRGGTKDAALLAWAKVDQAVRSVGTYRSVCFDDPLINAVLADMGGWIALGQVDEDDLPFRAKEFENRYRGYVLRGPLVDYPRALPGIAERDNAALGRSAPKDLVFVGDAVRAQLVHERGASRPLLGMTPVQKLLPANP